MGWIAATGVLCGVTAGLALTAPSRALRQIRG